MATTISTCIPCTAGSYCATIGLSAPTGPCGVGYYCPEGSTTSTGIVTGTTTVNQC